MKYKSIGGMLSIVLPISSFILVDNIWYRIGLVIWGITLIFYLAFEYKED